MIAYETFRPGILKVFVGADNKTILSYISANFSTEVWLFPAKTISKCISSETKKTPYFSQSPTTVFISLVLHTLPTGLCGEQNNSIFGFLSANIRSKPSKSISYPLSHFKRGFSIRSLPDERTTP